MDTLAKGTMINLIVLLFDLHSGALDTQVSQPLPNRNLDSAVEEKTGQMLLSQMHCGSLLHLL